MRKLTAGWPPQRDRDHRGVLTCHSNWSQHPLFLPSGTSRADVGEEEQTERPTKNAVITLSKSPVKLTDNIFFKSTDFKRVPLPPTATEPRRTDWPPPALARPHSSVSRYVRRKASWEMEFNATLMS